MKKSGISELELLLVASGDDEKDLALEYIKNNPAVANAYIEVKGLEARIILNRMSLVALLMAKAISDGRAE